MAWAKLHTDLLGDPKLMRAARKGAKHLALLPWLIVFAKLSDDSGRLSVGGMAADPEDIAALLPGVKPQAVAGCIQELTEIGVLVPDDDGTQRFARWEVRSGRPSDSPASVRERVAKHRAVKQAGKSNGNAESNAVTVTTSNATEKRREEKRRVNGVTSATPLSPNDGTPPAASQIADVTRQAAERWQAKRGEPAYGRIGKALKPLVQKRGARQVLAAWDGYLVERDGKPFATPEDFAQNYELHRRKWAEVSSPGGDCFVPIPDEPMVST